MDNFKIAAHHRVDQQRFIVLGEGTHQVSAPQDADDSPILNHRKVLLWRSQKMSHSLRKAVIRRERLEFGHHSTPDRNAAQAGFHLHHAGLLLSANPDEEGDEEQEGVAEQANDSEQEGHALPDAGGNLGRLDVFEAQGKQRPQDAPAIHREGRQQVEADQEQVDGHQPLEERAAGQRQAGKRDQGAGQDEVGKQDGSNDHVDGRAGQRHPQFLDGLVGHALQAGDAADGQQGDVAPLAVAAGGPGVAVLVQDDREEEQQEAHAFEHAGQAAGLHLVTEAEEGNQEQEGSVNVHVNVGKAPIFQDHRVSGLYCQILPAKYW